MLRAASRLYRTPTTSIKYTSSKLCPNSCLNSSFRRFSTSGGHRQVSGGPLYLHGAALTVMFASALSFYYLVSEDRETGRGMFREDVATTEEGARPKLGALPRVFMSIKVGEEEPKRIVIELRSDVAPRTCENFRRLCTGEMGYGFASSRFHRIIPGFMAQGGDITSGDGTGGRSIYGSTFSDETFELRHTKPGLLSMANAGPNTNSSQFFITLNRTPWLDGKHVVFGEVTEGLELLQQLDQVGTKSGAPTKPVIVTECGQLASQPLTERQ